MENVNKRTFNYSLRFEALGENGKCSANASTGENGLISCFLFFLFKFLQILARCSYNRFACSHQNKNLKREPLNSPSQYDCILQGS